jgi:hypothetical protein
MFTDPEELDDGEPDYVPHDTLPPHIAGPKDIFFKHKSSTRLMYGGYCHAYIKHYIVKDRHY